EICKARHGAVVIDHFLSRAIEEAGPVQLFAARLVEDQFIVNVQFDIVRRVGGIGKNSTVVRAVEVSCADLVSLYPIDFLAIALSRAKNKQGHEKKQSGLSHFIIISI